MLAGVAALALAAPAAGDDVPRLAGSITDRTSAQVLSAGRARVEAALDDLLRTDDVQLFVLFVETTGGRTVTGFADETARVNSLGGNDALLVVALADRTDALWRSGDYLDRLTDRELQDVLARQVEPRLRDGDFAGAVVAGAEGVGAASRSSAGSEVPAGAPAPAVDLGIVVALLLVAGGVLVLWSALATRRRARAEARARERRDAARAHEANGLLIKADEALRDAREEMGFAEAQFSAEDVAPYRDAVSAAATELKAAFTVRQQLDDAVPEDAATRAGLVEQIVARATKALALLEEQRRRVDELRDLQRRAPELLLRLRADIDAASARLPEAERTLAGFVRYAEASWSSVTRNVVDARDLLSRAAAHAAEGETATKADDAGAAAKAVRAGQQDLGEAVRLIDAIGATAAAIAKAEGTARGQLAAATSDVEKARAAVARGEDAEQRRRVEEARAALAAAEKAVSSERPDFLTAVQLAAEAGTAAGAVLSALREEAERREREARLAATQLQAARDAYRRAADYISPRRRAIGSAARTRLAEAERHLDDAERSVAAGELAAALPEARSAQRLADEAWSLAQHDVHEAESAGPWTGAPRTPVIIPFPFPMGGGGRPGSFPTPGGLPGPGRSVGGRW